MWNKLTDLLLKIYDLVRITDRHTKQIIELEKQFNDLQRSFERFALAYQKDREREETERKFLLVQVENLLLRQKLNEHERYQGLLGAYAPEVTPTQSKELPSVHHQKDDDDDQPTTETEQIT
jgi:hypothetical protein